MTTPSPTANAQDVTATHTPGPWNVGSARLVWVDGTDIAQVIRTNGDQATAMANARLIAAAPDLLAVVQHAYTHGITNEWSKLARAAIAKATAA